MVANPPYMGSSNMGPWLSKWAKKNYPDSKPDLCTCFIERGFSLSSCAGLSAMVTMQSWMFLGSFEKMRAKILSQRSIVTMAHLGTRAFSAIGGEVVSTTATVFSAMKDDVAGAYFRLVDMGSEDEKREGLLQALANPDCGWFYQADARDFEKIPGSPVVYWARPSVFASFESGSFLGEVAMPRQGLATGENARFVRQWWEVSLDKELFDCPSSEEAAASGAKWFPYNKGGEYRKWYGNNEFVINWESDGKEIRDFEGSVIRNPQCYFKPCITWSKISSGSIAFRYKPAGHVFDVAGTSIFAEATVLEYLHGACNSSSIMGIAEMLSPTLNFEVGQIASYPIVFKWDRKDEIVSTVQSEAEISEADWDCLERSWNFRRHPLA